MDVDRSKNISASSPIPPTSRFEIVDIVRGFALFGVLLANMVWTTQWFAVTDAQRAAFTTADIDRYVQLLVLLLVDFKFYTLFAMLFGLGFAMQLSRAGRLRQNVLPFYRRRLAILFFIGVAHSLLLWFGDILHLYALLGFVLILFSSKSDRVIVYWALGLALLTSLMPFLQWITMVGAVTDSGLEVNSEEVRFAALTSGSWLDVLGVNWAFTRFQYMHFEFGFDSTVHFYLSVLWKFLIGFVIGR